VAHEPYYIKDNSADVVGHALLESSTNPDASPISTLWTFNTGTEYYVSLHLSNKINKNENFGRRLKTLGNTRFFDHLMIFRAETSNRNCYVF